MYKDVIVTYLPEHKKINAIEWDWLVTNFRHKPGYSKNAINKLLYCIGENIIFSLGMNSAIHSHYNRNPLIEFLQTKLAVKRFNELVKKNIKVVAFIHLTC